MNNLCTVITDYVSNGSFASLRNNVVYSKTGYARVIRLVDFHNNYSLDDAVFISKEGYDYLSKTQLHGGEIVISNVGINLGESFIVPTLNCPMSLGPNSIMIKTNQIDKYIYYYFNSERGLASLKSLSSGSAVPKFNKTDFRQLCIQIHDPEIQRHIVDTIGSVDDLIENYKNKITKMIAYGSSLYIRKLLLKQAREISMNEFAIKYGKSVPKSNRSDGKYKLYASNGCIDNIDTYNAENAIIFGCRGTIGSVFYSKEKCFVLNTAFFIESDNEYGSIYFSIRNQEGMKEYATGAAQPQITISSMNKAKLFFANTNIFNLLLDLASKYEKILENLNKIKDLLLHKYFD